MQRIMIVGQPGSGKSRLARQLGARLMLPVYHIDHIHWQSGWVERDLAEKDRMCLAIEALPAWVFEGGHSATYANRLARADLLIWLDLPVSLRLWRVTRRCVAGLGRNRPDLPDGCPERLANLPEFWRFIWRTRGASRVRLQRMATEARGDLAVVHLRSGAEVKSWLAQLPAAP